jgi:hypothetical protein
MKNLIILLFLTTSVLGLYSCDSDSLEQECLKGIVLYEIPCNSPNGLAYLIKVNRDGKIDSIATTTLPSIYKIEGQEIFFFIREPQYELFCTTSIIAPKEYDIYNVSNNGCSDE